MQPTHPLYLKALHVLIPARAARLLGCGQASGHDQRLAESDSTWVQQPQTACDLSVHPESLDLGVAPVALTDVTAGGLQHGDVIAVIIPRPATEGVNPSGVGKVVVEFTEVTSAVKARNALHGRKFSGRTVTVDYIPEAAYSAGDLD